MTTAFHIRGRVKAMPSRVYAASTRSLPAYITTTVPCHARLSNNGKTLGSLIEAGMKLDARLTASFLFEVQQDGFILTKNVQLPLQGVDVQIFAEAPRATGRRGCSRTQAPEVATETLSLAEIFVTRGVSAIWIVSPPGHTLR